MRCLALVVLAAAFVLALAACSVGADTYPIMPDLSKASDYQAKYDRMAKWGKDSCEAGGSLTQLINDYYPSRDPGSIRKGEAASALQEWIQFNHYDEASPDGSSDLSDAVYQGCLDASKGWG